MNKTKRYVDTQDFHRFCRRIVRAYGRRLAADEANELDLADAVELLHELDAAIKAGARAQASRTSWAEVAKGLGTSRQNVWRKYGDKGKVPA